MDPHLRHVRADVPPLVPSCFLHHGTMTLPTGYSIPTKTKKQFETLQTALKYMKLKG
jgi:hypothetical protein